MFKFYVDDGSEESSEIEFSKDDAGNNIWTISCESNNKFSPINIMIKDTTGKYVVGRLTILPTVETSTSETTPSESQSTSESKSESQSTTPATGDTTGEHTASEAETADHA